MLAESHTGDGTRLHARVGASLAAELSAFSGVIAAKGVLRFPEIRSASEDDHTDVSSVTEYFLIGTLASWLQAFALTLLL